MKKRLIDTYCFTGFLPTQQVESEKHDNKAIVITMRRRQKKQYVMNAEIPVEAIMTGIRSWFEIFRAAICGYILPLKFGVWPVVNAR
ncbi:MAG: hypothetical protein A2314_01615 [Elusimicrobia bacterium RIFOXYB2_FULL_50_12]|nr:MAG: hypothetical protein A2314_01615 [Elusimicrobia bacterium RIFOXYB2_FULL_50_12]